MPAAPFDFDVFTIVVASQLLGFEYIQESFINASDEVKWYWRSCLLETPCVWIDSAWELQRGKIVWKLGALWKKRTGGVYVQSDALSELEVGRFFKNRLSIDLESSPTIVLAETFARALQNPCLPTSAKDLSDHRSIYLHFPDLEMTVTFPLINENTGTRTELSHDIVSRLQFTGVPVSHSVHTSSDLSSDKAVDLFQTWKSNFASPKIGQLVVTSTPVIEEKSVSNTGENSSNFSRTLRNTKRSRVHGYSKVPSRSRKRPDLKFKEPS